MLGFKSRLKRTLKLLPHGAVHAAEFRSARVERIEPVLNYRPLIGANLAEAVEKLFRCGGPRVGDTNGAPFGVGLQVEVFCDHLNTLRLVTIRAAKSIRWRGAVHAAKAEEPHSQRDVIVLLPGVLEALVAQHLERAGDALAR